MVKKNIEELVDQAEEIEDEEEHEEPVEFTSYGADIFDLIGGGGAPFGRVVNIIGDNSVGKSFISSEMVAQAKKKYGDSFVWYYDDAEAGYSFNSKKIWGFEIVNEDCPPSETIEDFQINVDKFLANLKPNQKGIYILDSFDSLSSLQEHDEYDEKVKAIENGKKVPGTYAQGKAKGTNQFFRLMRNKLKNTNCLLVIISQVRENIGGGIFDPKYRRNGGKSLDLYASQIFWLAVVEKYKRRETVIGVCVQIKNTKNKVGKPYRSGYIDIIFDYGLDNTSSNIKYLYDLKTDSGKDTGKKGKDKLKWDEHEYSLDELIDYIEDNGLENELTKKVYKKWKDFEKSISTERKKRH